MLSSVQDPGNYLWSQVQTPSGCVSSGKLLNFSVPQFLLLTNGPLQEKDKLMWTKFFEQEQLVNSNLNHSNLRMRVPHSDVPDSFCPAKKRV